MHNTSKIIEWRKDDLAWYSFIEWPKTDTNSWISETINKINERITRKIIGNVARLDN